MDTPKEYYLGLDIGTDSIGYAVTNQQYELLRFHGEKMWGATLFDPAGTSAERRGFRTSRRRLHRRQHRIQMLKEIFAEAIGKIDPNFFRRLEECWKLPKDKTDQNDLNGIFNDTKFTDKDYFKKYPTIHHLICDLMDNTGPHDVRLVYLACAWMMAHRGHFLSELNVEGILAGQSFSEAYEALKSLFKQQIDLRNETQDDLDEYAMWKEEEEICRKLQKCMIQNKGISWKKDELKKILVMEPNAKQLYPIGDIITLLAGGSVKLKKIFPEAEENDSASLGEDEEALEVKSQKLGDDGELLLRLKQLYDGAELQKILNGKKCISKAKIDIYEQHKKDLQGLKRLLKKYLSDDRKTYNKIFVDFVKDNYVEYIAGKTTIIDFNIFLKKELDAAFKEKELSPEDQSHLDEFNICLENKTFLPKQVCRDNRTIPYQLFEAELRVILKNAAEYLPFLKEFKNGCSLNEKEKILKIFTYRMPYYVGPQPLTDNMKKGFSPYAWLKRKSEEPVRPWNVEEVIDTIQSERNFIDRMVNICTYCPGQKVLPKNSLLYQKYEVLNELNNICARHEKISIETKQGLFDELFKKHKRVTRKMILAYLMAHGYVDLKDEELTGIDIKINSSLNTYHAFKPYLENGILTDDDVEKIVLQRTCTEDSRRFAEWLKIQAFSSRLDERAQKQISRLSFKDFGRLSRYFLAELPFGNSTENVPKAVIQWLWDCNNNLNELLSEQYTLKAILDAERRAYYEQNKPSFEEQLDNLYLSTAVKRQIYRTKDIVESVLHAMKGIPPKRIFVEMARGATEEQKNKRTISRQDQLIEKLIHVKTTEIDEIRQKLQEEGIQNRLQSDKLYLWFMQLGKCPYCGRSIPLEEVYTGMADIDHIYPQCLTKDDSILNNKVLAHRNCNGEKSDTYPLPENMCQAPLWGFWLKNDLITQEKYNRLIRREPLTEEEKKGFINRQLVETRQTTKAVLNLLKERFPNTEVISVKAGLVSDLRAEFDMLKCRSINDLHHAKDAYLNIVAGNVYNEIFNRNFYINTTYSMKTKVIFEKIHRNEKGEIFWNGKDGVEFIQNVLLDNHIHLTKYQISKTAGALFDIQIVKKGNGQIQSKKGREIADYGGYNKPSMAGFILVSFLKGKKGKDVIFLPIPLEGRKVLCGNAPDRKEKYLHTLLDKTKIAEPISYPLGYRLLRIGTMLSFNGLRLTIAGRANSTIAFRLLSPFCLKKEQENYIKKIERTCEKLKKKTILYIDVERENLSTSENLCLFNALIAKIASPFFRNLPGTPIEMLENEKTQRVFSTLLFEQQLKVLQELIKIVKTNRTAQIDLSLLGGKGRSATIALSTALSNMRKYYNDIRIIDTDAAGLFEKKSQNLLDFLK